MPDGTFTAGGVLDYITRTTVPTANDIAKKAICLLPGTSYTAVNGIPYSATINPNASGGTSINGLQKIDFSYHIRGGLRGINLDGSGNTTPNNIEGDLFSYKLDYETAGQWNGNIGKQYWNSNLENRNYTFTYDAASRLKSATFVGINAENYSLPQINYDKNGNILNLQRNGKIGNSFGQMDNLTYTYSGNKLTSITDAISGNNEVDFVPRGNNAYTYWPNGALKSDANEQINNIVYNTYINQPINVSLTDGRTINSTYHGGGTLLKNTYSTGEYWEFVDDMIFKNGTLYQLMDDESRLIYNSTTNTFTYEFDYKDHLGNSRISFKAENGTLVQTARTDFDPWGVVLKSSNTNLVQNRFELQNHEKEMTFGLNRVNFGARTLNPTTGVFDRTDRFSEKYYSLSPFQFSAGNPIRYVDINGDSLIVMSAPEGAKGAGHAAVLIGNDKTGWELYSKNGTNDAGGLKGENNKGDNRGEGKASKFKTLSDFANSKSSPQSTDKTESGKPEYQKAFLLESDSKTDEKMKLGALNVLNKDYTLLGSSCVDVCSEALKAGGFDPGKTTVLGVKLPLMYDTPNLRYIDMKNNNNGKDVTRLITPKNN